MITRAYITEVISASKVRVRIPMYDRIPKAGMSVEDKNLSIATICSPPNMIYNPNVGDVVFVGFEDNDMGKPVVLGYLIQNEESAPVVSSISVMATQSATMPYNTNIGSVRPEEIKSLENIAGNIQWQIDALSSRVDGLEGKEGA